MSRHAKTAVDPCWNFYPNTVLELGQPPSAVVDLRLPLDAASLDSIRAMQLAPSFAVLTGHNPRGRLLGVDQNARRAAELRAIVVASGFRCTNALGRSPDSSHGEMGLAIVMPRSEARELALRFEQSAFFWFDGSAFWLDAGIIDVPSFRLPS